MSSRRLNGIFPVPAAIYPQSVRDVSTVTLLLEAAGLQARLGCSELVLCGMKPLGVLFCVVWRLQAR